MQSIDIILQNAATLVGIPYKWHRDGNTIAGVEDKFYATNTYPPPSAAEIRESGKSMVCTGLINWMRRLQHLSIPGLDGTMGDIGLQFPGTTGIWFEYLHQCGRLREFCINAKYPRGTLLLRNFSDVETDQGHVAVLFTDDRDRYSCRNELILHSYANVAYEESNHEDVVGEVGFTVLAHSHFYQCSANCGTNPDQCTHVQVNATTGELTGGVYYTHVCLPEDWLMRN